MSEAEISGLIFLGGLIVFFGVVYVFFPRRGD